MQPYKPGVMNYSGSLVLRNWILPFRLADFFSGHISNFCVSINYWNSLYYAFSEVFKLCETENLNFAVYFMIDKHPYEKVHLKVEPKSSYTSFLIAGIHCIMLSLSLIPGTIRTWLYSYNLKLDNLLI